MSISKSYNRQNDTTYVYEVIENYWDKEKKQSRNKRKLIGKIDPVTGEIVPTSPRRKKKEQTECDYKKMYESAMKDIAEKDQRITELESLIDEYVEGEERALQSIDEIVNERRRTIRKIKTSG